MQCLLNKKIKNVFISSDEMAIVFIDDLNEIYGFVIEQGCARSCDNCGRKAYFSDLNGVENLKDATVLDVNIREEDDNYGGVDFIKIRTDKGYFDMTCRNNDGGDYYGASFMRDFLDYEIEEARQEILVKERSMEYSEARDN